MESRPPSFLFAIAAALLAAASIGVWVGTLRRSAWADTAPRYACIHRGNVMLFSSLWNPASDGVVAWRSDGWIYDAYMPKPFPAWRPGFGRVGDTYSGTPQYKAILYAISIPAWLFAIPFGVLAWRNFRRVRASRSSDRCAACGYALVGLTAGTPCPECGRMPGRGQATPD